MSGAAGLSAGRLMQALRPAIKLSLRDILLTLHVSEEGTARSYAKICDATGIVTIPCVSRAVTKLTKRGILQSKPVDDDRRSVELTLTIRGKELVKQMTEEV